MAKHRRTTVRTQRAFPTMSHVGRALALFATPAPTVAVRYPSAVDGMSDRQVTAAFARLLVRNGPWGEA